MAFKGWPVEAVEFYEGLEADNTKTYWHEHKRVYEDCVKRPMEELLAELADEFGPGRVFRPYRDTRFSEDKSPLKTHVAAVFPTRGLAKGEGAGLYVEITPGWVWMGGGWYAPDAPHLLRMREHIASTFPAIERIERAKAFKRAVGALDGERLTRVPRGFSKDDPAAEYLKFRHFIAGCEYPPEFATSARFYPALVETFRSVMPLVRFLNEPFVERPA